MHWQRPTQEHAWWKRRTTVCRVFSCYVFAWRCASALRPAGADGRMFRRHILNSGAQEASKRFPGGYRSRVTPVPIPNTEVKPATADGTAWVTVWESRSLPGIYPGAARKARPFFCFSSTLQRQLRKWTAWATCQDMHVLRAIAVLFAIYAASADAHAQTPEAGNAMSPDRRLLRGCVGGASRAPSLATPLRHSSLFGVLALGLSRAV